jgi:hypothetical protein
MLDWSPLKYLKSQEGGLPWSLKNVLVMEVGEFGLSELAGCMSAWCQGHLCGVCIPVFGFGLSGTRRLP